MPIKECLAHLVKIGQYSTEMVCSHTAGTLAEGEILKQEPLINSLPMGRLQMLTQVLQGRPNIE